ncbi:MAG: ferritin family protein [Thermoplasmata archaeon]|nr:ferritin family protein [Thermoplasmata archaeon]
MDLDQYSTEDLILTALKAEVGAKEVYSTLADGVKNAYLSGRLRFLAGEEEMHRAFLDRLYHSEFEGREPVLPDTTPVPLPDIAIPSEQVPITSIFTQAMTAEMAASEFYADMADRWAKGSEAHDMLLYFSKMEMGHYKLLETERDAAAEFEDFDQVWPLMHAGP